MIAYGFRYSLGVVIHGIWMFFIYNTFKPNLINSDLHSVWLRLGIIAALIGCCALFIYAEWKLQRNDKGIQDVDQRSKETLQPFANLYVFTSILSIIMLVVTSVFVEFNHLGYWLMMVTSLLFLLNYVLFRMLRTTLDQFDGWFYKLHVIRSFKAHHNYLFIFFLATIVSLGVFIYSHVGTIKDLLMPNGIFLLLAIFYVYHMLIASSVKYFFCTVKFDDYLKKYRIISSVVISLILFFGLTWGFVNYEKKVHQLETQVNTHSGITEEQFLDSVATRDHIFYIASHGGGLKANIWTLLVLNKLQQKTEGKLFKNTVGLSGASGGSLGLALYLGLFKNHGMDTIEIQRKIEEIAVKDHAAQDLAFTFGLDSFRKLILFSEINQWQDRPYYSMRGYQNIVEQKQNKTLITTSFRDYWKEAFEQKKYAPSLIMNTAGTNGKRGVFWSVQSQRFDSIFNFATNLADLDGNRTLDYYQAVSTTNRFPVFSPAAKIAGYGHFMDAGAIDNSGLLGCLDLHLHLANNDHLKNKKVVFIEIANGKSIYIEYLLNEFLRWKKDIDHLIIDEDENDNIIVNIQTGLNLDKIPGYLSSLLLNQDQQYKNLHYIKIMMPHKVFVEDVEAYLDGDVVDQMEILLEGFLEAANENIDQALKIKGGPNSHWDYYEPVLSRHMSDHSFSYMRDILADSTLNQRFEYIQTILNYVPSDSTSLNDSTKHNTKPKDPLVLAKGLD